MECLINKTSPEYCSMIDLVVDGVFCEKHCQSQPDRMSAKIQRARKNPVKLVKINGNKNDGDAIIMAKAAAICKCGVCGKHRDKKCNSRPCAIRNDKFIKCPDNQWAIEDLIEEANKQIGV